jgi:hypothetical protein
VWRQYRLDYTFENDSGDSHHPTRRRRSSPPSGEGGRAIAIVREGRLGWPWVEALHPAPEPPR